MRGHEKHAMKSKWVEADAAECVARGADGRITPAVAAEQLSALLRD